MVWYDNLYKRSGLHLITLKMIYSEDAFTINVEEFTPNLSSLEYMRLWAFYLIRVCYNFAYNDKVNEIMEYVIKIRDQKYSPGMNCLNIAEVPKAYASSGNYSTIVSHFFTKEGTDNRLNSVEFIPQPSDQQVIYSTIALLDYAFGKCSSNIEELKIANEIVAMTMTGLATANAMAMVPAYRDNPIVLTHIPESSFFSSLKVSNMDRSSVPEYQVSNTALSNPLNSSTATTKLEKAPNEGCYIATSVYGSYDAPNVIALRRFRDNYLSKNSLGKVFIKYYYQYSPKLVSLLKGHHFLNKVIRHVLNIFVYILKHS